MLWPKERKVVARLRGSYSPEFKDLCLKMLIKDPRQRIGYAGGAAEILQHPWFPKGDELVQLENLQATAPIIPDNSNEINPEFFNVGEGAVTESIVSG